MKESEIGNFLRLLTHDLQNQLGAIDLNLQIIPTLIPRGDAAMQTLEPFVSRASIASHDMIETLGDIQSFAQSVSSVDDEDEAHALTLTRINVSTKVRDCALILSMAAKNRQITLLTAIEDDVMATAEAEGLQRSIRILANEALRSSFPESTVVLSAFFSGSQAIVEISTTQVGVFEEHRPMLSIFIVRHLLEMSASRVVFVATAIKSAIQIQFQTV